ncbi:MAG TPA: hypothetical protein VGU20_13795 [Stellaceae bacterium]|nr:hypothetical protein [Stellaceae bacterium]
MTANDRHKAPGSASARPRLLLCGLDSLYVSYYLDVRNGKLDFEELAVQKERAREARKGRLEAAQVGSESFAVMPYGKHPYAYVLTNDAFEVRLSENMSPSCHVQYGSHLLWHCGLEDSLNRFDSWCGSLGLRQKAPEVVARADWAFDYALPDIDFGADHFISRFKKDSIHRSNRKIQTFTFGRGDCVIRVYDKVAEIEEESHKYWFFPLWGRRAGVWRIEFQVRGARLQQAGMHTTDDLRDLQNDLVHELATNHTTLRQPSGDSNRARWPLHPLWRLFIGDITQLPRTGLIRNFSPHATLNMRLDYQGRALHGTLKGYAALLSERHERDVPLTFEELLAALGPALRRHHNPVVWHADVGNRLKAMRLGQW